MNSSEEGPHDSTLRAAEPTRVGDSPEFSRVDEPAVIEEDMPAEPLLATAISAEGLGQESSSSERRLWHSGSPQLGPVERPTFLFLGVVASLTLIADIGTKGWAEVALNRRGFEPIEIVDGYLSIILAYNRGGAWGLMQNASEFVRKPFFVGVSAMAILFIVSLYSKLQRSQRALTWGLPLVLGGALGNLSDRITRSQVIDFIDYRSDWVLKANAFVQKYVKSWSVTDHWPTFNVADIAICIGVALMAIDMMSARRPSHGEPRPGLRQGLSEPTPTSMG